MGENDDLLPEYLSESLDLIEMAHNSIDLLVEGGDRGEMLNSIFRAVHTIKGGSSIFGMENTRNFAHKLENFLGQMRTNPSLLKDEDITKISKILNHLELLLKNQDNFPRHLQPPSSELEITSQVDSSASKNELNQLTEELNQVANEEIESQAKWSPSTENQDIKDEKTSFKSQNQHEETSMITNSSSSVSSIKETPNVISESKVMDMLKVPVERVQKNLDVISEVFLIRNQMTYLVDKYFAEHGPNFTFIQAWEFLNNALRRSIGELENVAMSMRMMPLKNLFSRMEKTVRGYATETGKKIIITKKGDDTELDKKVIDTLGEPLIHLIRNAMDHGIETPEERKQSGKEDTGKINLEAKVVGNEAILFISDNGRGIDVEKVKNHAIQKEIDISKIHDDAGIIDLIFLPGFSTNTIVTETSGRGVGMDVVKTTIEKLGGNISTQTKVGKGTTFTIRLPLSMSVIPAIIVRINRQLLAVATSDIIETKRISIKEVIQNSGEKVIKYRGNYIPYFNLADFLYTCEKKDNEYSSNVFVCIVRNKESFMALQVGSLEHNTEIVVKPLPALSPEIHYITGTSVLPTGQPVFVLSLGRLGRDKLTVGETKYDAA